MPIDYILFIIAYRIVIVKGFRGKRKKFLLIPQKKGEKSSEVAKRLLF